MKKCGRKAMAVTQSRTRIRLGGKERIHLTGSTREKYVRYQVLLNTSLARLA